MEDLISVFKTLSDKTRLRILSLLEHEELSVQEIVEIIGAAQSGISRHLSVLKSSGFIKDRKEGQNSYYSINSDSDELKGVLLKKVSELTKGDDVFSDDFKKLKNVLESRKELSRLFFESRAFMYDDLAKEYESEKLRVFSMLALVPKGLNVLDLGCGTGRFLPFLASAKANIVAVDLSDAMLKRAKERMASYDAIKFYACDAGEVPIEDGWADACFINMVLHHVPNPAEFFTLVCKYLKNGAKIIVTDFKSHNDENMQKEHGDLWLGFSVNKLSGWMLKSGFSDIEHHSFEVKDKEIFTVSATKN